MTSDKSLLKGQKFRPRRRTVVSGVAQRFVNRAGSAGSAAAGDRRQVPTADATPCVVILLCTYNGAQFLMEQLNSIELQSHHNWRLVVSDDGSSDDTLDIVARFGERTGRDIVVRAGPQRGACANFISLAADPTIHGEYFAFCDQDDIWHPDKLAASLAWMDTVLPDMPAVYGARTRLMTADGKQQGCSPLFTRPPSFGNSLVQSIAGANTMLLNAPAKRLLEAAGEVEVISHDWWAYQLVSGTGGAVYYDAKPHLDYRQHAGNRIGTNKGLRARMKRASMALDGQFAQWNETNLAALGQARHLLTPEACALTDAYQVMRTGSLVERVRAFSSTALRRQTSLGTAGLLLAALLKKL
jgi:Glycosyl transferase family 2